VDRTGENRLAPGQDYRQGVAVPPDAFPAMFLLCHSGGVRTRIVVEETRRFDTNDIYSYNFGPIHGS